MLSVFMTPWTKPTRIQCAIIVRGALAHVGEPIRAQLLAIASLRAPESRAGS